LALWFLLRTSAQAVALRLAIALRALRLLRLPRLLSVGDKLLARLFSAFRPLTGLIGALVALFFFFGQLGVALFGGKVRRDAWHKTVAPADYVLCNFNDFFMAQVTLFELLIVNNWQDIMDAIAALTSPAARAFFIVWYVVAVTIMLNLVVAHILDAFVDEGGEALEALRSRRGAGGENETVIEASRGATAVASVTSRE
jgi:hypothetical protein